MSIIEPGWVKRWRQRRRERRWQADTRETVTWAASVLTLTKRAA
jgi:hypothetical protein